MKLKLYMNNREARYRAEVELFDELKDDVAAIVLRAQRLDVFLNERPSARTATEVLQRQ